MAEALVVKVDASVMETTDAVLVGIFPVCS